MSEVISNKWENLLASKKTMIIGKTPEFFRVFGLILFLISSGKADQLGVFGIVSGVLTVPELQLAVNHPSKSGKIAKLGGS